MTIYIFKPTVQIKKKYFNNTILFLILVTRYTQRNTLGNSLYTLY